MKRLCLLSLVALALMSGCQPISPDVPPKVIFRANDKVEVVCGTVLPDITNSGDKGVMLGGIYVVPGEGCCVTKVCIEAFIDEEGSDGKNGIRNGDERLAWRFCTEGALTHGGGEVQIPNGGGTLPPGSVWVGGAIINWSNDEPPPTVHIVIEYCCDPTWCGTEIPPNACRITRVESSTGLPRIEAGY